MATTETLSDSHSEQQSTVRVTADQAGEGTPLQIRDRIKDLRRVRAGDLVPNPKNWRRHPRAQANALGALFVPRQHKLDKRA